MDKGYVPNTWEPRLDGTVWKIFDRDGALIATLAENTYAEARAKMIAMCPYMMEALNGAVKLMGDEDLPDNGEFSGAAVSDMIRTANDLTTSI